MLEETSTFDKPLAQLRQFKVKNQVFGYPTQSLGENWVFQKSGAPDSHAITGSHLHPTVSFA